ncbi:MAG: small multi-drug export protein [Deltaproteobacteria bacterium]|nr:small multi-drug export protein [Deltaproteobacteria bacterium]
MLTASENKPKNLKKGEKKMKSITKYLIMGICLMVFIAMPIGSAIADNSATEETKNPSTIIGTVNDSYQVVSDNGQTYDIEVNDPGNELIEQVGNKVEVVGIVEEADGLKSINVMSYKILGKPDTKD